MLSCARAAFVFGAIVLAGLAEAQSEFQKFHQLLDDEWAYVMEQYPEFATAVGWPGQNHRWTDRSMEAIEARREHTRALLERVEAIDREQLDEADKLDYDLYLRDVRESVEGLQFRGEFMPIDQMSGVQLRLASNIARMPAASVEDYENMLARLRGVPEVIDEVIALMEEGRDRGLMPPKVTLTKVPEQIRNQIVDDPEQSSFLQPFQSYPESVAATERARLTEAAAEAYANEVRPALEKLADYVENTYLPDARESIDLTALPDGEAWYAYSVKVMTTTDMTPREIHDLGKSEVKRIRGEMEKIIEQTEFEGDFEAFTEFLRTDPQFFFEQPEALLQAYRDIAKRADPELVKLFGTLPRLPYGVKAVPAYAEKSQTTAYYEAGSLEAGRPGYFFANTYDLKSRPKWEMEALTLHEAVPGHHLQIAIAQELDEMPEFRKWGGYTAFIEGWGLYAESLGEEMGFYTDPYSKFGQLTYEMWRAVRLVVDTGMHALGWSRQDAIDYFKANTGKAEHDIEVEVDRYIAWPGQALAYKIGELKFKELRARAKEELGENFDIREFHDALLKEGALPMDVLESYMVAWIEAEEAQDD